MNFEHNAVYDILFISLFKTIAHIVTISVITEVTDLVILKWENDNPIYEKHIIDVWNTHQIHIIKVLC